MDTDPGSTAALPSLTQAMAPLLTLPPLLSACRGYASGDRLTGPTIYTNLLVQQEIARQLPVPGALDAEHRMLRRCCSCCHASRSAKRVAAELLCADQPWSASSWLAGLIQRCVRVQHCFCRKPLAPLLPLRH